MALCKIKMKSIVSKKRIFNRLEYALGELGSTEELIGEFREAFKLVYKEIPLLLPYELNLVKTEELRYSEFYQTGPDLSEFAIEIKGSKYCEYLWKDLGDWVLADEFYTPAEIAEQVCNAPIFTQMPENVKELKWLLSEGCWRFMPEDLPKFGGITPEDSLEIISWDNQYLLVGTQLENIEMVSRDEWDRIRTRETYWLK